MVFFKLDQIPETAKYDIILTDPPWRTSKGGKKAVRPNSSGTKLDYDTQTLEEITECLKYATVNHTNPDSVLFMWAIDKFLFEAQNIAESLGYKLHARMCWNKVTGIPSAFTIRFGHEYLLYMYKGKFTPVAKEIRGKIHSVFTEKVRKHSQKPEISYKIISDLYPDKKKLEMYSRQARNNWDSFGNQVNPL